MLLRNITFSICLTFLAETACSTEFQDLLNSFGSLQTIAGTGRYRSRDFNGWNTSMEGGSAMAAELSRPHMTMADTAGNLYIADKDANAIRKVLLDGKIHTVAGTNVAGFNGDGFGPSTQLDHPNGLYTLPDGTTYILDLGNSMIRRLGTDGQLTTVIQDPTTIRVGRGLWVSPDESLIYYATLDSANGLSGAVKRWTPADGLSTYATGFDALGNLDVDPTDGNLVITDRGGHRVYKVFSDGTNEPIAGNGTITGGGNGFNALQTGLNEVRGIHFRDDGSYLLATHDGGQVWFVDTDDVIHLLVDGNNDHSHAGDGLPLSSPGKKISEPRAVTLAPDGDLIITESDFGYIRIAEFVPEPRSWILAVFGVIGVWISVTGRLNVKHRR